MMITARETIMETHTKAAVSTAARVPSAVEGTGDQFRARNVFRLFASPTDFTVDKVTGTATLVNTAYGTDLSGYIRHRYIV
jgi:hypothetical protein